MIKKTSIFKIFLLLLFSYQLLAQDLQDIAISRIYHYMQIDTTQKYIQAESIDRHLYDDDVYDVCFNNMAVEFLLEYHGAEKLSLNGIALKKGNDGYISSISDLNKLYSIAYNKFILIVFENGNGHFGHYYILIDSVNEVYYILYCNFFSDFFLTDVDNDGVMDFITATTSWYDVLDKSVYYISLKQYMVTKKGLVERKDSRAKNIRLCIDNTGCHPCKPPK